MNGDVLATFQYHGGHDPKSDGGGLVEFDEKGKLVRDSSAMDPAARNELIRPYSLVVVPSLDRVVSTNTSMHFKNDARDCGLAFDSVGTEVAAMGADWGDFDRDGLLDLTVTNFERLAFLLYRNSGDNRFVDVAWRTGTGRYRNVAAHVRDGVEHVEPSLEDAYLLLRGGLADGRPAEEVAS